MDNQVPEILTERMNKRMAQLYISKKEMAERLGMEYLTFWRKSNGKRGIDVVLLMRIAQVLGTTAAYLLGETNNPVAGDTDNASVVIRTNDASRRIVSEPARLSFHDGDVAIDIPDTPANKRWFNDFILNIMSTKSQDKQHEPITATA